jgi:arsenite methyltransferase
MAYVGCIAGAVKIDAYRRQLKAAGFAHVEVIDSGRDLNAYAKVENQAACCSPAMETQATSCCTPAPKAKPKTKPKSAAKSCCCGGGSAAKSDVHAGLKDLLSRYDVNDYAASVKVFAVKP